MKIAITVCLCLALASSVSAVPLPSASQIIQKEGRLAFTDGSSFYDFEKNGTFHSGPMGMSGRTIEGHWKPQQNTGHNTFVIKGTWSWMNGLSEPNDVRKMTMRVTPKANTPKKILSRSSILVGGSPDMLYSCSFTIKEIIKMPQSK